VGANTETRRRKISNSSEFKIKISSKFKLPLTAVNLKYQKKAFISCNIPFEKAKKY